MYSFNQVRKNRKRKKGGQLDEQDDEDSLPSWSDGSQEGRLWELKIGHP